MKELVLSDLIVPLGVTCGAIVLFCLYPHWILAVMLLAGCIPMLFPVPRMLVLLWEISKKSLVVSSPALTISGQYGLNKKAIIPIVRDNYSQKEYLWCTSISIQPIDHIAYVIFYPRSRVIIRAIPIEELTTDRLILAVFLRNRKTLRGILSAEKCDFVKDSSGRNALHWAYRNHMESTIEELLGLGCDYKCVDSLGLFPVELNEHKLVQITQNSFLMKIQLDKWKQFGIRKNGRIEGEGY